MKKLENKGFTIIELMIATVVFSIILIILAGAIIQIGRLYNKGITSARVQSAARSAVDNITQAIQFNGGTIAITPNNATDARSQGICVGNRYFMYRLGQQRTGEGASEKHALISTTVPAGCSASLPINLSMNQSLSNSTTANESELLGDKMRLSKLDMIPLNSSTYKVTARVVYGDYDLLCSPSRSISCDDSTTFFTSENDVLGVTDLACKNIRAGSQYCSVSELSTTVERRLTK